MERMKPYKQISTSVRFQNPWWRYCLDQIELPSGKPGEYHYVLTYGSSMVIPVDDRNRLLLVRQYRYTGQRDSIEFPCGGLKEGDTHETAAANELVEETGFVSGRMVPVGSFNPCNGLLEETCMVYVARDLRFVGPRPDETESFELVRFGVQEMESKISDGTIWDGMTLAAWAIAKSRLE